MIKQLGLFCVALSLAGAAVASDYRDCPTLANFQRGLSFSAAGMVPPTMPYYDEFAGYADPYYESEGGGMWIVLNNKVRISDGPSGNGRAYMTVVVTNNASDATRAEVLASADAVLAAATQEPSENNTYYEEAYGSGDYTYEICMFEGTGTESMGTGDAFAELLE
mgnify:CR=1 FL=1